jgi:hypothetical protein
MYKESGFLNNWEIKARPLIKTGSGIDKAKFTAHEEAKIIRLLEKLWKQQFDKVTRIRVIEAMQKGDIPAGFLSDIDSSLEKWVKAQFMPAYASAMTYAANGSGKVAGMMDDINRAIGAEILFNPNTIRMTDYITEHGVELAVQLQTQQKAALKTMLNKVIRRKHLLGTNQNEITQRAHDLIRKSITLTNQETKWLSNFRDRTLKAKIKYFRDEYPVLFPDAPVLSEKQIIERANAVTDDLVDKRYTLYKSNRARRIMDTELSRAKVEGDLEAHRQALEAGIISEAQKQWQRNDFKTPVNWQSTLMYDGKRIDIDESFFEKYGRPKKTTMLNGSGPGEINEHCTTVHYVRK